MAAMGFGARMGQPRRREFDLKACAARLLVCGLAIGAVTLVSAEAMAEPGTHPVAVSSWDPRASSIVLTGLGGFMDDGHFHTFSYSANFSSTSGILSAQFGAHYLNLKQGNDTLQGISASGTAVFVWPVMSRYDNGVPRVGIGWYLGAAPAALLAGDINYLTAPLVTGLGLPLSPTEALTITPWGEVSPSLNLDSEFVPLTLEPEDYQNLIDPTTGEVRFDADTAGQLFTDTVELELSTRVSVRGGLHLSLHLDERASFDVKGSVATIGDWDERERVFFVGGGFTIRWDRIVPAVLPPERRLAKEDCDDIAARHRACSLKWQGPQQPAPYPNAAPPGPATPNAAPPGPAPPPAAPPPAAPAPAAPRPPPPIAPHSSPPPSPRPPSASSDNGPPPAPTPEPKQPPPATPGDPSSPSNPSTGRFPD